jgi:hypothetical protein
MKFPIILIVFKDFFIIQNIYFKDQLFNCQAGVLYLIYQLVICNRFISFKIKGLRV